MTNKFNILTIDGGGIKGIRSLYVIDEIEAQSGMLACKIFDLIGGTSTGGIIAALLSIGYSAKEIISLYEVHGGKIFDKKFYRLGIFRPKYSDEYLNKVIELYVKNKTLVDCKTGVIIPAYNIDTMDKVLFKNDGSQIYSLFDVIRATVSAQSYFEPHIIYDQRYIDGGNVINNTSLACYVEYLKCEPSKKPNIISIGTGRDEESVNRKASKSGLIGWANPTVNILMAEQAQQVDYYMQKLSDNKESNIDYLRIDPCCNNGNRNMDDASLKNMKLLELDGKETVNQNKEDIIQFVEKMTNN